MFLVCELAARKDNYALVNTKIIDNSYMKMFFSRDVVIVVSTEKQ